MAVRPVGTGTISFGLVTIPVKVYSANKSSEQISFNLLHEACGSRVRQQYICPQEDVIVDRTEMIKGYEFSRGQYVLFSAEELKALESAATQTIDIVEFVPEESVDPIYFDRPFYLGPDRHGQRPYALLSKALEQTSRWALARYATRGKSYLVAIRPYQEGLLMQQLRYASEIRRFSELDIDTDIEIRQKELDLAITLADQVTSEKFEPENYRDEESERIRDVIAQKIEGKDVSLAPEKPKGEVIDLMEALKRSLERSGATSGATAASSSKTSRKRKPAKKAASKKKPSAKRKAR